MSLTRPSRTLVAAAWSALIACGPIASASRGEEQPALLNPARTPAAALAADLGPLWECLTGERESWAVAGRVRVARGPAPFEVSLRLERHDGESYDLTIEHTDHALVLRRRADATALALPRHKIVHVGRGTTDPADHLAPAGLLQRLVSPDSQAAVAIPFIGQPSPAALAGVLCSLLGVQHDPANERWERHAAWLDFDDAGRRITADAEGVTADLSVAPAGSRPAADDFPSYEHHDIPRDELERTVCRGIRRTLEILLSGPGLVSPVGSRGRSPTAGSRGRRDCGW
jgi:hypothetical protein